MTQPTRFVGDRDGGKYLLEATTEIRQAEGGDWRHAPDRPPSYCRPGESTAYDYAILRELCKLEAPEGYELVNDGVEAFKAQKGDKSFINAKWCSNGVGNTVRAPVCRPIAKEEPEPEEPGIYGVGCYLCNGPPGNHERTHVCKTCYEEAVAESDTLQKERGKLMLYLRGERRKSGDMLEALKRVIAYHPPRPKDIAIAQALIAKAEGRD